MMDQKRRKKLQNALVAAVNAVLIIGLVFVFLAYENDYRQKLFDQNLDDISNLNQASANIASTFLSEREAKLRDLALYIEEHGLTAEESMDYVCQTNSDATKSFELVGPDYSGYRLTRQADGSFPALNYASGYGNFCKLLQQAEGDDSQTVHFMPEFTDAYTAMRSFALFTNVRIQGAGGQAETHVLMIVANATDFVDLLSLNSGYEELATVIINHSGSYILGDAAFKSDNFFKYLYVFNELTLDARQAIQQQVNDTGKGSLRYADSMGRDCVFVYTLVPNRDWYCVTVVPTGMFHNRSFDISFSLIVLAVLLFLLAVDFLYLYALNRRLRISVENEKVASAAKTDFLSRMSHDIRTPLNVIIGMSLLAQDEQNPPETAKCLKNIDESGKFLLGLVNDVLDLNKVESGKMELHPEPYSFAEFHRHIGGVIVPLCQSKGVRFEMTCPEGDDCVLLDRLRVNQIFFNLLSNAVKFTPEAGLVQLICTAKPLEEDRVALDFEVRDSGIGMSQEYQAHMFEAFSQEHRKETASIQGTGLGLAIVGNLVGLMGGTIRVESAPGEGTTFFVHIETERAAVAEKPLEAAETSEVLSGKRILLCEDHPLNAQIATKVLEKRQLHVEHAPDGSEGVRMFQQSALGYYDAILMDIRMPVMDGLEATRAIRALNRSDARHVPIIAMTANAYDIDKQNSFDAGMNAHIAKPIDPKLLYETLEEQIQRAKERR